MPVYKLRAKKTYGDMPQGYRFQLVSSTGPTPNPQDIRMAIKRLGFNLRAQSFRKPENFEVKQVK